MKKVYLFYIIAATCLFLAIFAVLSLADLANLGLAPAPPAALYKSPSTAPPKSPPAAPSRSRPKPSRQAATAQLDYPNLSSGAIYSVSRQTEMSTDPEGLFGPKQRLLPSGVFRVEGREKNAGFLWYRISVSNGADDYTMYLKAKDLNRQRVRMVRIRDGLRTALKKEHLARMSQRREAARTETTPLRDNLAALSLQDPLTTAIAAAIATLAIVLTIAIMAWLNSVRRWRSHSLLDESSEKRGEEFYEEPARDDP